MGTLWRSLFRFSICQNEGICLVWLVFLYADIFVVVSSDADVCPNGAELGGKLGDSLSVCMSGVAMSYRYRDVSGAQ